MPANGKSAQRAVEGVYGVIADNLKQGRSRLPTIADMAASLHLSHHAVRRAVAYWRDRGVLSVSTRTGIHLRNPAIDRGALTGMLAEYREHTVGKASYVAQRIVERIQQGAYTPGGQVHSCKELSVESGCTYRTVRRALHSLCDKGMLERYRRGYRVAVGDVASGRNTIVFIGVPRNPAFLRTWHPYLRFFWPSIEMECTRLGLRLVLYGHDQKGAITRMNSTGTLTVEHIERAHRVLGYVVWTHNMPHWWVEGLFAGLAATGKPVAVLTDALRTPLEMQVSLAKENACFAFFPLGTGRNPGVHMGKYLAGLGHRSVAFFTIAGYGYAEDRALGLAAAMHDLQCTCRLFSLDRESADELRNSTQGPFMTAQARVSSLISWLTSTFPTYLSWQDVFAGFSSTLTMLHLRSAFRELFEQALSDKSITAWVGMRDQIALGALDFLNRAKIPVPQRISVAGFDDSIAAFSAGMTSLNFGSHDAAIAMVGHIVSRQPSRKKRAPSVIRIHGTVMARGTTGPPPSTSAQMLRTGHFRDRA